MKHLSGVDSAFLHLESPEMPMHIGSLNVVDLPEGYTGDFFEDTKAHIQQRMHLADVFTRKLMLMPLDLSNPVWVEDEDIDMDYHVRHVTLPKPGSNRQLQQYVARLHSSLLDRSRPLWEFFVIDGLKSGQVALYCKVHHAGLDGQAGVAVAKAIFDLEPTGRAIKAPRPRGRREHYQLGVAELLGAAVRNTLNQSVGLVKSLPLIARSAKAALIPAKGVNGKREWSLPKDFKIFAPRTSLNVAITNQRTFAGRTVPLSEVKQIAKALGVSLNDVVMATTAGALRAYLKDNNELPDKPLCAAVPVSLRQEGDMTSNNQVTMVTMNLATHLKDPLQRLQKINESSASAKVMMGRFKNAIPMDFPLPAAPWLMSALASLFSRSRLANVMPPIANLIISNVQGIPVQLYFAGAKVVSYYPVSIPSHSMALNVTVQSYNGRLDYGLIACRRAVPDVNDLADALLAEHRTLMQLAQITPPTVQPIAAPIAAPASQVPKLAGKAPVRKRAKRLSVAA
ncbi:MAG TPA: wax ester/triacylglycerol synthase family O-acyltransferase [Rhodoferax sp.]|nr:wax ester/triacylglycerol synthase family O-acyltransferase [Rhodoferax sp.]